MNSHRNLKNRIRAYRLIDGITQSQLAVLIGVSKNTISSIETGVFCPSAYTAYLLCNVFNCKFDDLFYLDSEVKNENLR